MADSSKQQGDEKQTIYLIGASRGAKDGARRSVDKATAERMVRDGLARLPKSASK